jgi:hypothetical protein
LIALLGIFEQTAQQSPLFRFHKNAKLLASGGKVVWEKDSRKKLESPHVELQKTS